MSEADVLLLVSEYGMGAASCFGLYTSFIFAYLTVAYLVGEKLDVFQARVVSALFIAGAGVGMIATVSMIQAWVEIINTQPTVLDRIPFFSYQVWHYYMGALQSAGIIVGLYFMADVRKKRDRANRN